MLFEQLAKLEVADKREYDALAQVTQHPRRPRPKREADQIYMLPGSQLHQAKLMAPYLAAKSVVFVGDGDCMALSILALARARVIAPDQVPNHILVLDFDDRLVTFINELAVEWKLSDQLEAHYYNVADVIPSHFQSKHDVFYVNPPYGSKNEGFSAVAFIARGIELCTTHHSRGVAILPYEPTREWTQSAMYRVQQFLISNGFVVSEMLTRMHAYHLDDRPELQSGTLVADKVVENSHNNPLAGRAITESELTNFYGAGVSTFPRGINAAGDFTWE